MRQSQSSKKVKNLLAKADDAGDKDEDDEMAGLNQLAIDVDLQPI